MRPISTAGFEKRAIVDAPVVVSPVERGKFAIIDGQHRTTSAAILGVECVPCQIVIAALSERAAYW
jgi:ParB-like chromosome segregation protein Spo0J